MSLQTDIKAQMVEAMKAREANRVSVLRGLMSAFTNELVAKGRKPDEELGDDDALTVISRQVKQRKDSIEQFEKGKRLDLADAEKAELQVLQGYLPDQMSQEEIRNFIEKKIAVDKPALSQKGPFLGQIMKELKGRAEGGIVKLELDKLMGS